MDKIIYGKPLLPRAVSVEPLADFILKIKFNNDEEKLFDVKKMYELPCFPSNIFHQFLLLFPEYIHLHSHNNRHSQYGHDGHE